MVIFNIIMNNEEITAFFKAINAKKLLEAKVYNECVECKSPKLTERDRDFALCCRCNARRKKLLRNGL
jgi:hypothetical protein